MAIGWALAIVGTLALLFLVDKTMGLRVSAAEEAPGSTSRSTAKKATTERVAI